MKKMLVVLSVVGFLTGCTEQMSLDPESMLSSAINPFREYKVNDTKVADEVEKGILETEARKYGIDLEKTSAHMISFKKVGSYGSGEIRILGNLSQEGIEKAKKAGFDRPNPVLAYTCSFEYSYKNNSYTWKSEFPYK